jgi:hypothetical protein
MKWSISVGYKICILLSVQMNITYFSVMLWKQADWNIVGNLQEIDTL